MPKSGIEKQKCSCESGEVPQIALTFIGSSLHVAPRIKTSAVTLYICPRCVERMHPFTKAKVVGVAIEIADVINTARGEIELEKEKERNGKKPQ